MDEMNDGFTPAQKKYLDRFATKEDLADAIKGCASKSVADALCVAVVQLQEDVRGIREDMTGMRATMATKKDIDPMATKKDIDRVLAAFDSFGRRIERRLALLEARA